MSWERDEFWQNKMNKKSDEWFVIFQNAQIICIIAKNRSVYIAKFSWNTSPGDLHDKTTSLEWLLMMRSFFQKKNCWLYINLLFPISRFKNKCRLGFSNADVSCVINSLLENMLWHHQSLIILLFRILFDFLAFLLLNIDYQWMKTILSMILAVVNCAQIYILLIKLLYFWKISEYL